jgi:SAM-dependent methyltransferase
VTEWARYYAATGDEPRETLLAAVEGFESSGLAIDLGCGTGRDTVELLRRGWRVVAIDSEEEAISHLRAKTGDDGRLETQVARYEDATLPPCDLVNASWSLPFCRPEMFDVVWERIANAVRPGGRFCGQLFGERDEWAAEDDMTFHTREEAERLFVVFELERFDELEEDGKTALGTPKHWHVFHIVAQKR